MTAYEQLVKALRCKRDDCEGCDIAFFDKDEGWMCQYAAKDDDAAAAIEALQAEVDTLKRTDSKRCQECLYLGQPIGEQQLPKRGEWIYHPKDAIEMMFTLPKCSICGHESSDALNYCPYCGAKMNDSNASNALNALDNAQDGPIVTPCRGCSDYDGYGGCKSKDGCARAKMEVQDGQA